MSGVCPKLKRKKADRESEVLVISVGEQVEEASTYRC